jgi:hypothetical protein
MISFDNTIISDDLKDVFFCCDLEKCKGACCIEGDAGAPLDEMEIIPYMVAGGVSEIKNTGVFDYDADAKFVTPLIEGRECAYVYMENGIARCAIEKAFQEKKIPFPKPLSCHLYPVRIGKLSVGEAVNYHKWHICSKAIEKGMKMKLPLYEFLEEALIRKYGRSWYNRLLKLLH